MLAEVSLDGIRPDGGADKPSLSTNSPFAIGALPIVAAEDEIAMLWGKKLAFYDDTLTMTATLELPGDSVGIISVREGYYVTYSTGDGLTIAEIRDHADRLLWRVFLFLQGRHGIPLSSRRGRGSGKAHM